jgi:hypothetical protein
MLSKIVFITELILYDYNIQRLYFWLIIIHKNYFYTDFEVLIKLNH